MATSESRSRRTVERDQAVWAESFALFLIYLLTALPILSALLFLLGVPITRLHLPMAILIATTLAFTNIYKRLPLCIVFRTVGTWLVALLLLFGMGLWISSQFYDLSYDGQFYHQEAILRLVQGWNPVWDSPLPLQPERLDHDYAIWVNSYPKAAWTSAAALVIHFGRIELGKTFQLLMMVAVFFMSYTILLSWGRKRSEAVILGFLLAGNPVCLYQALSYYVDGLLASSFTLLTLLFVRLQQQGEERSQGQRHLWLAICILLIYLVNIKFTGLIYALLISLAFIGWRWIQERKLPSGMLLKLGATLVIGSLVVGYQPYVTNLVRHGNPLHPLLGEKSMDVIKTQFEPEFLALPSTKKLLISLFSYSANDRKYPTLKLPFSIHGEEFRAFVESDARIGGFGPLFGGVLIFSLLLLLLSVSSPRKRREAAPYLYGLAWLLLTVVVNPVAWWARFAPQLWLLPIACVLLALNQGGEKARALALATVILLELNIVTTTLPHVLIQHSLSQDLGRQLEHAAAYGQNHEVVVKFNMFDPLRERLAEAGVEYRESDRVECEEPMILLGSRVQVCAGRPPSLGFERRRE